MQVKLPEFMRKWNFLKLMLLSGIVFCIGLFFGYVSPSLLKAAFTSVSEIRKQTHDLHKCGKYLSTFYYCHHFLATQFSTQSWIAWIFHKTAIFHRFQNQFVQLDKSRRICPRRKGNFNFIPIVYSDRMVLNEWIFWMMMFSSFSRSFKKWGPIFSS